MPDLTPEKLAELRRLLDEATTLPWYLDAGGDRGVYTDPRETIDSRDIANAYYRADEVLIAAAVDALPALLAAAELLAEVRDQVTRGALCPMCSTGMTRRTVGLVCQLCGTDYARPEYASMRRGADAYCSDYMSTDTHRGL